MNRFDRARDYITQLEKVEYDGVLRIRTDGVATFIHENTKPTTLFTTKSIPLGTIEWGLPGSYPRWKGIGPKKTWKDVIIAALYKLDIKDIETLTHITYDELYGTKGIKGIAPIIKDSLARAGYHLKK